jgi:hypothetical protein
MGNQGYTTQALLKARVTVTSQEGGHTCTFAEDTHHKFVI